MQHSHFTCNLPGMANGNIFSTTWPLLVSVHFVCGVHSISKLNLKDLNGTSLPRIISLFSDLIQCFYKQKVGPVKTFDGELIIQSNGDIERDVTLVFFNVCVFFLKS